MDANDLQKLEIALRQLRSDMDDRFRPLEQWKATTEVLNAERRDHDKDEMLRVHVRLEKIESVMSRLVWLVLGGIVSAFMAFLISGGLSGAI